MKKLSLTLLIVFACLALFVACGESTEDTGATKAPATAKSTAPANPTGTPETTEAPSPTPVPTEDPMSIDPEVDAVLFRFWHEDKYMYDTDDFITSDEEGYGNGSCIYYYEKGAGLVVEITNGDPNFDIPGTGETGETFDLTQYPFMKVRIKNTSPATKFECYITDLSGEASGRSVRADITSEQTEYNDYVFDLVTMKGADYLEACKDGVGRIRMDCLNDVDQDKIDADGSWFFYIDYIGFFKTAEDAANWNPTHVTSAGQNAGE